jgi:hypothetical protein
MDELDRLYRRLVQNIRGAAPELLTRPFEVSQLHQELVPYRTNRRELGFDSNEEYELALMQLLGGLRGYLTGETELQEAMRAELSSPNPDLTSFRVYSTSTVALAPEALRAMEHELAPRSSEGAPSAHGAARTVANGSAGPPPGLAERAARATESLDATPAAPLPAPSASPATAASSGAAGTSTAPLFPSQLRATSRTPVSGETEEPRASALEPIRREPGSRGTAAGGRGCRYCGGTLPDGRKITFCPHCGHNLTVQHCPACATELEVEWKFCITCGRDVA